MIQNLIKSFFLCCVLCCLVFVFVFTSLPYRKMRRSVFAEFSQVKVLLAHCFAKNTEAVPQMKLIAFFILPSRSTFMQSSSFLFFMVKFPFTFPHPISSTKRDGRICKFYVFRRCFKEATIHDFFANNHDDIHASAGSSYCSNHDLQV
jgi:hypothetical protein